jgi:hypothetical protein
MPHTEDVLAVEKDSHSNGPETLIPQWSFPWPGMKVGVDCGDLG